MQVTRADCGKSLRDIVDRLLKNTCGFYIILEILVARPERAKRWHKKQCIVRGEIILTLSGYHLKRYHCSACLIC
jgi:hypothetical protein